MHIKNFHALGYLHSDVKPNNVVLDMISKTDDLFTIEKNGTMQV